MRPTRNVLPEEDLLSGREAGKVGSGKKGFYGVSVSARHKILFLIDVSGSINSMADNRSRYQILTEELQKVVSRCCKSRETILFPKGRFRVMAFSNGTSIFPEAKQGMARFDSGNTGPLKDYLNRAFSGGGTHMSAAWKAVLPLVRRDNIDVIYFLTDGESGDGDPTSIAAQLPERVVVHCFSIGHDSEMMKKLASLHNGRYVLCL